jgi:hypothetical protein
MKVIFLDVDGVLNTPKLIKKFGFDFIDHILVALVARIVRETDAKIVLSSTWRIEERNKVLVIQSLAQHNLELHDCTPVIQRSGAWTESGWVRRHEEIQAWLNKNPNAQKFAIIDDFDDANIEGSFFQTDENIGLTVAIAEKIIEHLK